MMTCDGENQCIPPLDVLSNLPESVIDDILEKLPLRDAVRTSILSKKWRCNWCRLPHLKLDQTLWKTTEELVPPTIGFANILCHILILHTRPITKFTLDIPDLKARANIDHLIYFLSINDVQHLVFKPPQHNQYKLPSSFFTCSQLRHLFLERCLIRPPPFFNGFDRLISLQLIAVTISSECLASFISHCPLLEHLVLKLDKDPYDIEINAPKLRSFIFAGHINLLHLKNVPLLSKVSCGPIEIYGEGKFDLAKFLESIPALENFFWEHNYLLAMQFGPAEDIPTRLPFTLYCLKHLYISRIALGEFFDLSLALCLIRSSPNLEEIEIKAYTCDHYYERVPRSVVDEIPASFSDMTFNHLKSVKINSVAGAEAELQLIKALLAKSPALIKMVIQPCQMEDKKSLKVLAEITNFQRASSKAQVVYNIEPVLFGLSARLVN